MKKVQGYLRPDGSKGIRNLIAVVYTVECSEFVAQKIGEGFEDVQVFGYRSCNANPVAMKVLRSIAVHPNLYGIVFVSLGCESTRGDVLAKESQNTVKPAHNISIQETGGTKKTIEAGRKLVEELLKKKDETPRVDITLSDLRVASNCGGSDATSGLAANPLVGEVFDCIVDAGGTCFFDEIVEMIGCREMAAKRASTSDVAERILESVDRAVRIATETGDFAFAAGNVEGGLSTIEEKSLGAYMKSGHRTIEDIIKVGERPAKKGLYLIDSVPDVSWRGGSVINDLENISNGVGAGAQMLLFTTGRGSPVGGAVIPIVKITGNPYTARHMSDDIDIDASPILYGDRSVEEMSKEVIEKILQIAGGEKTLSEAQGRCEIHIHPSYQNTKTNC